MSRHLARTCCLTGAGTTGRNRAELCVSSAGRSILHDRSGFASKWRHGSEWLSNRCTARNIFDGLAQVRFTSGRAGTDTTSFRILNGIAARVRTSTIGSFTSRRSHAPCAPFFSSARGLCGIWSSAIPRLMASIFSPALRRTRDRHKFGDRTKVFRTTTTDET